jgi:glycosyltransferase involved in cell wall biosynthesis
MRVLQVNKFLYGGAGAETVMFRTADLLRSDGHDVSFFAMQDPRNAPCAESDYFPRGRYYNAEQSSIQRAKDAVSSIYSWDARRALRNLVRDRRPDIAHMHNIYHQLTLSVVDELAAQGIPMVMTLHDYKPVCPSYVLYTDNKPCHRCVTGHPGHAIAHRCIKGSRIASAIGAAEALMVRTRSTYDRVDAFISPSRHLADIMMEGGLPAERMHVLPNFIAEEQFRDPASLSEVHDASTVLFVGRLEAVKGIRVLLAAARELAPEIRVVIVGQGALEDEVRQASDEGVVEYLGPRGWEEIAHLMDRARALVVPSLWEENCPMVVLEAGARGCAVIASAHGGLVELVDEGDDGLLFPTGNSAALAGAILRLCEDPSLSAQLGSSRYGRTREKNAPDVYLRNLLSIYQQAL